MAQKTPVTPAIRMLRKHKIDYSEHLYDYVPKGGTKASSEALAVPEETVVKTIVLENEKKEPLIVLMTGDRSISQKKLARHLGCKTIQPCQPEVASKHTGYLVGGTSPFGTKKRLKVYMESKIQEFETVYINGGKRGFLVGMKPADIIAVLQCEMVEVGI